jgi:hypothetical protein
VSTASVALFNSWRDLMRSWGFTVLEADGCDIRSASSRSYRPGGLFLEHHDASSKLSGLWGSIGIIIGGRGGANPVPGPLANLQFARDGQVMIVAKNPANHGGTGGPLLGVPANDVNINSCGAEVANDGLGEEYSSALSRAIVHGEAAWAIVTGRTADYVRGHKEWTSRKSDPVVDMNSRRADVAAVIANRGPLPGTQEDDMSQKAEEQIQALYDALFRGGPSTPYGLPLTTVLQQLPASTAHEVWTGVFVNRPDADGVLQKIPVLQELADSKTQVIATRAEAAGLQAALAAAHAGQPIDLEAVKAASAAGARQALAEGVKVTIDVPHGA